MDFCWILYLVSQFSNCRNERQELLSSFQKLGQQCSSYRVGRWEMDLV